jgi:hypothetical protein
MLLLLMRVCETIPYIDVLSYDNALLIKMKIVIYMNDYLQICHKDKT